MRFTCCKPINHFKFIFAAKLADQSVNSCTSGNTKRMMGGGGSAQGTRGRWGRGSGNTRRIEEGPPTFSRCSLILQVFLEPPSPILLVFPEPPFPNPPGVLWAPLPQSSWCSLSPHSPILLVFPDPPSPILLVFPEPSFPYPSVDIINYKTLTINQHHES